MNEKLEFLPTFKDAFGIGVKNATSIIGATILWFITLWIPYINVGTTIALSALPTKLSRGEIVNPTYIFDSQYRHIMGEYMILTALIISAITMATFFMIIPGIVLCLSWSLAIYLLIDKNMNWAQCLTESNRLTMGYKKKIFFLNLALCVVFFIIFMIITSIIPTTGDFPIWPLIAYSILWLLAICVSIALEAVIYRELTKEETESNE